MPNAKEGAGHPLVQQQGQQRNNAALEKVQRRDAEDDKGDHVVDAAVDGGAHTDDGLQRHAVELGKFGD